MKSNYFVFVSFLFTFQAFNLDQVLAQEVVPGQYIVKYKKNLTDAQASAITAAIGSAISE